MSLQAILLVGTGGALGAVARYGVGLMVKSASGFPWATLSVNIAGSLLMGLVMGWLGRQTGVGGAPEPVRLFLAVGLLGGFTTFSAFSLELVGLLERRELVAAGGYLGGSVLGGVAAFLIAYSLVKAS